MLSSKFYLSSIFSNQRFRLLSNKFVEKLDLCFLIVRFFSTAAVAATVAATAAEGLMRWEKFSHLPNKNYNVWYVAESRMYAST